MSAARIIISAALLASLLPGQTSNLSDRLQHSLAGSPDQEVALRALSEKNLKAVRELLAKRAASTTIDRSELLSLEGAVAFLDKDMPASVLHFEQASKLATLRDGDRFTEAMALVSLGEDERARLNLASLAQEHPEQALYVYWLGRLDYDAHRYSEAVEKLQKAVSLSPKSVRAWDSLGLAFDMQGQMQHAYEAFSKAVELNRSVPAPSPWPPHNLGYLCLRMQRVDEAESALRESLRDDPNLEQSHYHLARVLEKENRDADAAGEYRIAIAEDMSAAEPCYSLALLCRKMHRESEANAMFREYKKRKGDQLHAESSTREGRP